MGLRRFVDGATPAERIWDLDLDLRPEGKQGPVARSLDGYAKYFHRWALPGSARRWPEPRPVAGDPDVAASWPCSRTSSGSRGSRPTTSATSGA